MTTIAWDGRTLAADRQVSSGHISDGETTKIVKRKKDGALCATAGPTSLAAAFKRWFLAGGKGDYPGAMKVDDTRVSAFIIQPDRKFIIYDDTGWYEKVVDQYAEGSGYAFAIGAMAAGKDAYEAVHIAARYDNNTGYNIDTLELGK